MSKTTSQSQSGKAWFVVTEPGDEERFQPTVVDSEEPSSPNASAEPQPNVEPDPEPEAPEAKIAPAVELPQSPEIVVPAAEPAVDWPAPGPSKGAEENAAVSPGAGEVPAESAPALQIPIEKPSASLTEAQSEPPPEPNTAVQQSESMPAPSPERLPPVPEGGPASSPAPRPPYYGFHPSEVIRIGGNNVTVPIAQVGLIVTVRTPQPVRLGQVTVLKGSRTVVGRGRVACFVDDPEVADWHVVITWQSTDSFAGFCLHTCDSALVTLNGCKPEAMVPLRSGDRIGLGGSELVFLSIPLHIGGEA